MCAMSVNVTVSMPIEMVHDIDDEADKCDMSRAEYIRNAIRESNSTPFECPDFTLEELADSQPVEEGAA